MRLKPAQQYATVPLTILTSGLLGKLSLIATKTYMVLLLRSDSNRNQCWPAIRTIASDANMSTTSVLKAISELEGLGLIVKQHRVTKNGDAASNLYTVMVPDLEPEIPPVGVSRDDTPCITTCYTGVASNDTEPIPLELTPENKNTPTGSASADAPTKAVKPDVYQAVLEVYNLAGMPEPPKSEVGRLLKNMKEALSSGWNTQRIANAWTNARKHATNPHFWTLSFCLVHLTEAEAMSARPGGKPQKLTDEELEARARANAQSVQGVLHNDR